MYKNGAVPIPFGHDDVVSQADVNNLYYSHKSSYINQTQAEVTKYPANGSKR